MVTKFENLKKEVFTSKEHYLAFRQAWSDYINSGKAKKQKSKNPRDTTPVSPLTGLHHLVYNILIGNDIQKCYTISKWKVGKLGFLIMLDESKTLNYRAESVIRMNNGNEPTHGIEKMYVEIVDTFLEPFDGTVTPEMLVSALESIASIEPEDIKYAA